MGSKAKSKAKNKAKKHTKSAAKSRAAVPKAAETAGAESTSPEPEAVPEATQIGAVEDAEGLATDAGTQEHDVDSADKAVEITESADPESESSKTTSIGPQTGGSDEVDSEEPTRPEETEKVEEPENSEKLDEDVNVREDDHTPAEESATEQLHDLKAEILATEANPTEVSKVENLEADEDFEIHEAEEAAENLEANEVVENIEAEAEADDAADTPAASDNTEIAETAHSSGSTEVKEAPENPLQSELLVPENPPSKMDTDSEQQQNQAKEDEIKHEEVSEHEYEDKQQDYEQDYENELKEEPVEDTETAETAEVEETEPIAETKLIDDETNEPDENEETDDFYASLNDQHSVEPAEEDDTETKESEVPDVAESDSTEAADFYANLGNGEPEQAAEDGVPQPEDLEVHEAHDENFDAFNENPAEDEEFSVSNSDNAIQSAEKESEGASAVTPLLESKEENIDASTDNADEETDDFYASINKEADKSEENLDNSEANEDDFYSAIKDSAQEKHNDQGSDNDLDEAMKMESDEFYSSIHNEPPTEAMESLEIDESHESPAEDDKDDTVLEFDTEQVAADYDSKPETQPSTQPAILDLDLDENDSLSNDEDDNDLSPEDADGVDHVDASLGDTQSEVHPQVGTLDFLEEDDDLLLSDEDEEDVNDDNDFVAQLNSAQPEEPQHVERQTKQEPSVQAPPEAKPKASVANFQTDRRGFDSPMDFIPQQVRPHAPRVVSRTGSVPKIPTGSPSITSVPPTSGPQSPRVPPTALPNRNMHVNTTPGAPKPVVPPSRVPTRASSVGTSNSKYAPPQGTSQVAATPATAHIQSPGLPTGFHAQPEPPMQIPGQHQKPPSMAPPDRSSNPDPFGFPGMPQTVRKRPARVQTPQTAPPTLNAVAPPPAGPQPVDAPSAPSSRVASSSGPRAPPQRPASQGPPPPFGRAPTARVPSRATPRVNPYAPGNAGTTRPSSAAGVQSVPSAVPPHVAAPHVAPPHGVPPHVATPHGVPHHVATPHGAPPHIAAPHGAPQARVGPHSQAGPQQHASPSYQMPAAPQMASLPQPVHEPVAPAPYQPVQEAPLAPPAAPASSQRGTMPSQQRAAWREGAMTPQGEAVLNVSPPTISQTISPKSQRPPPTRTSSQANFHLQSPVKSLHESAATNSSVPPPASTDSIASSWSLSPQAAQALPLPLSSPKGPIKNKNKDVEKWIDERVQTSTQGTGTDMPGSLLYKIMRPLLTIADTSKRAPSVLTVLRDYHSDLQIPQVLSDASSEMDIMNVFEKLVTGEREEAMKLALDHKAYAHALLIAHSSGSDQWQLAVEEFIAEDARKRSAPLAFVYRALAAETVEAGKNAISELKPRGETSHIDLEKVDLNLKHWANVASALYDASQLPEGSNAKSSAACTAALHELGLLLQNRGFSEQAQVCFISTNTPVTSIPEFVMPSSSQVSPQRDIPGVSEAFDPEVPDYPLDSYVLAESIEFYLGRGTPALSPHKSRFAEYLGGLGHWNEALKIADTVSSVLKSTKNAPPQLTEGASQLIDRCQQHATPPAGGWLQRKLSRPNLEKKWVSSFNKFVSGEDEAGEDKDQSAADASMSQDPEASGLSFTPGITHSNGFGMRLEGGVSPVRPASASGLSHYTHSTDFSSPGQLPVPTNFVRPNSTLAARPAPLNETEEEYNTAASPFGSYPLNPAPVPVALNGLHNEPMPQGNNAFSEPAPMSTENSRIVSPYAPNPTQTPSSMSPVNVLRDNSRLTPQNPLLQGSAPRADMPQVQSQAFVQPMPYTPEHTQAFSHSASPYAPQAANPGLSQSPGGGFVPQRGAPQTTPAYGAATLQQQPMYQAQAQLAAVPPSQPTVPSYEQQQHSFQNVPQQAPQQTFQQSYNQPMTMPANTMESHVQEDQKRQEKENADDAEKDKEQDEKKGSKKDEGSKRGWFSWLTKEDPNQKKVHNVKLGDSKKLIFDKELGRWIKEGDPRPEPNKGPPPPPKSKAASAATGPQQPQMMPQMPAPAPGPVPSISSAPMMPQHMQVSQQSPMAAAQPAVGTPAAPAFQPSMPAQQAATFQQSVPSQPSMVPPASTGGPGAAAPRPKPNAIGGFDDILAAASATGSARSKRRPARSRYVGATESGMPTGMS